MADVGVNDFAGVDWLMCLFFTKKIGPIARVP